MTTQTAAEQYEAEHLVAWIEKGYAVYNPTYFPVRELPVIYGFNNGRSGHFWQGLLIAEDGTFLGSHGCSSEGYMPHDLGILDGSRPDRHEGFRQHYPDGYRMEFVGYSDVHSCAGLQAALEKQDSNAG